MYILTVVLKIVAILALFSVAVLVGYVVFVVLPKLKDTLRSVQKLVDGEVKTAVSDIDATVVNVKEKLMPKIDESVDEVNDVVGEVNETIGKFDKEVIPAINEAIDNFNSTTTMLQEMAQTEIKPIADDIQEITDKLSSEVSKIDQVVDTTVDFVQSTVRKAEFCREQLIVPVIEIASFWTGMKAGFSTFFNKIGGKHNE